jgi:hypothetical protein
VTFIVRLAIDRTGRISGVVERVKTGQKERFEGAPAIGEVIARMVEREVAALGGEPQSIEGLEKEP